MKGQQEYSFYDLETGLFTGTGFSGSAESLAINTKPGYGAMPGDHDYLSKRVVNGEVVDYQPPSPGPDYEWNDDTKLWVLSAAAQQAADADAAARAQLDEIDRKSIRALREAAAGDASATLRLVALNDEAAVARADVIATPEEASDI